MSGLDGRLKACACSWASPWAAPPLVQPSKTP